MDGDLECKTQLGQHHQYDWFPTYCLGCYLMNSFIILAKEMATHSSILAWEIPWTERSLAGYSPWGC